MIVDESGIFCFYEATAELRKPFKLLKTFDSSINRILIVTRRVEVFVAS